MRVKKKKGRKGEKRKKRGEEVRGKGKKRKKGLMQININITGKYSALFN